MSNFEEHKETDGLEDFFSKALYEASMQPSKKSWENIEQAIGQDEKRKKRFLWFFLMGLILVLGTTSAWYILDKLSVNKSVILNNVHKSINNPIIQKHRLPQETNVATREENTLIIDAKENKANPALAEETKIQIGAFSKKINPNIFEKLSFPIQSETTKDGITKYYVVSKNAVTDLEKIKAAGFMDAFVKERNLLENENTSAILANQSKPLKHNEENGEVANENKTITSPNSPNKTAKNNEQKDQASNETNLSLASSHSTINHAEIKTNTKNNSENGQGAATTNNIKEYKALDKEFSDPKNKLNVEVSKAALINLIDSAQNKEPDQKAKTDSIIKIAKTDSVPKSIQKELKKDSVKTVLANRWAISLIAGPNVFLSQAKTALFDAKTEIQPITYSGELKVEYRFLKNLSASLGLGYQTNSIQKDSTFFKFSKYTSSDYLANSSFGPMAIDKNTLLQGFFMGAPVDSFFASYKYTATTKSINIPLQVNWCFLNQSKFQLYSSLGVNTSYIVSQESHLTLKKEHNETDLYYKSVESNRLNAILLLSLSCDIRLTKRVYFTAAPSYRYSLTNYSPTPGIIFKPSYLSLMGGLKIKL